MERLRQSRLYALILAVCSDMLNIGFVPPLWRDVVVLFPDTKESRSAYRASRILFRYFREESNGEDRKSIAEFT